MSNKTPAATLLAVCALIAALAAWLIWNPGGPAVGEIAPAQASVGDAEAKRTGADTNADDGAAKPDATRTAAEAAKRRTSRTGTGALLIVNAVWADGTPADGIGIRCSARWPNYLRGGTRRAITDDAGVTQFDGLPPGEMSLRSGRGGSAKAEVKAGETTTVKFEVPAGVDVDGLVVGPNDAPIAGASIWLTTGFRNWLGGRVVARSDSKGRFRIRSAVKDESIGAFAKGFDRSQLVDLDTLDTSKAKAKVRLDLTLGGGSLTVTVLDPDRQPVPGARVAIGKIPGHFPQRHGMAQRELWTPRVVRCDDAGRAHADGMPEGQHELSVRASGLPIWVGKATVDRSLEGAVLVVLERPVTVFGRVTDVAGEPAGGAVIRAVPSAFDEVFIQSGQFDFEGVFGYPITVTDAAGSYSLDTIAPGDVYVYAMEGGRRDLNGEAKIRVSTKLTASPGAKLEWNPVLSPGHTISGTITFRDGKPMPNVFVTVREKQSGKEQTHTNGKNGRFRFVNLTNCEHSIRVQLWSPPKGTLPLEKDGIWPDQGEVELVAAYDAPVDLPPGSVRGHVDDVAGRLANASALRVILRSDQNWWRTNVELDGSAFSFDKVKPGRYRVIAFSGETEIVSSDWFEVGAKQAIDIGKLTTEPGGTLIVRVKRGKGTEKVEPRIYLRPADGLNGRSIELGTASEQRLESMSSGKYTASLSALGVPGIHGREVTVEAGREATLDFELEPSTLREFHVSYPAVQPMLQLRLTILDADGKRVWGRAPRNRGALPNPYVTEGYLSPGRYTLRAELGDALAGEIPFEVVDLSPDQPPVRLQIR